MIRNRNILIVIIILSLLSGCALLNTAHRTRDLGDVAFFIDAKQRTIYSYDETVMRKTCSEPSPDVFSAIAASLGKEKEKYSAFFEESAKQIDRIATIELIREWLFRACEAYLNGALERGGQQAIQANFMMTSSALLAIDRLGAGLTRYTPSMPISPSGDGGKDNGGKDNGGKDNGGKDNGGKDNGGEDNGGEDNGGKDNGGKDNGGEDNGGKDNGGKDNGGKDNGGKGIAKGPTLDVNNATANYDRLTDTSVQAITGSITKIVGMVKEYSTELSNKALDYCQIKGNINDGERIYHVPGSSSYEHIEINKSGEQYFCSEEAAQKKGFRPACKDGQKAFFSYRANSTAKILNKDDFKKEITGDLYENYVEKDIGKWVCLKQTDK